MTTTPSTDRADLGPAWADLAHTLRTVAALFGAPGELAAARVLPWDTARRLRDWLRALEALARALLVALAARLPDRPQRPRGWTARRHDPSTDEWTDDAVATDASLLESERWAGVSFAGSPPTPRSGRARGESGTPGSASAPRFAWTLPLAHRLEALIRVAEAPERYARRVARRLAADPVAARRMLRPPPSEARSGPLREEVLAARTDAWRVCPVGSPDTG
jgi:hypothetical protein